MGKFKRIVIFLLIVVYSFTMIYILTFKVQETWALVLAFISLIFAAIWLIIGAWILSKPIRK